MSKLDLHRGDHMENDLVVAVIDSCRKSTVECDKDELTILCDRSELVVYKAVGTLCDFCSENGMESSPRGISEHGVFCADIIRRASAEMNEARFLPRLAIYAVGCPSCSDVREDDVALAIKEATKAKVKVISISLMRDLPMRFVSLDAPDLQVRDFATLDAMTDGVLVVSSAGNYGNYGLCTIDKATPCCLSVGSCTSYKRYKTIITFETDSLYGFGKFEGYSTSLVATEPKPVWKKKIIKDKPCVMYNDGEYIVIEAADGAITTNTESLVFISKETTNKVLDYINLIASDKGHLVATFASTLRNDLNHPSVSKTSGRGPCYFYKDYMKPDLCAPGEDIVAAWLPDQPVKRDYEGPTRYSVQSGTSFATPQVAAGVAAIMVERNFSPSATISAAIITADRMHGSDIHFEFAYGAGAFNLRRAMRPGLVYEEDVKSYDEYIFKNRGPNCDLNLPYFSATFPLSSGKWGCCFRRKMKNVEEGTCTYTAEVVVHATTLRMPLESVKITVDPPRLVFKGLNEEQKFLLNVDLPHTDSKKEYAIVSCSLIWTNKDDANIVVESPIILSSKYESLRVLEPQAF